MSRYDEGPVPPRDEELRLTIERVAEFVAKFGPEFEAKTQRENQGNPKFDFIFGGQFSDYYKYMVHVQLERNHDQSQMQPFIQHAGPEIEELRMRIDGLRQQIIDSERNLKAQRDSQAAMRDMEFAKQISSAEAEKVNSYLSKAQVDIAPFADILTQLNNPKCSKDAISCSKRWIFDTCQTDQQREVILMYLSNRVKDVNSTDSFRLNILYLINDWAHYCQRKKLDPVMQMLSRYVPQMYAFSVELSTDPNMQPKLEKLAGVWEGHKYFNDQCFKQLRNPTFIYNNAKQVLSAEYSKMTANIDVQLQAMYAGYEQQHTNFAQHVMQQIKQYEAELERFRHGSEQSFNSVPTPQPQGRRSRFDQQSRFDDQTPGVGAFGRFFAPPARIPAVVKQEQFAPPSLPDGDDIDGHPFVEEDLIPKAPYYCLPAGIMVPLIPMESLTVQYFALLIIIRVFFQYEPISHGSLRLPPPVPPSQRLIEAMDSFYAPPTSEKPRDTAGWEKNGLSDFFERKMHLKTIFCDKLASEGRSLNSVISNRRSEADFKQEREDREIALAKYIEQKKKNVASRDSRSRSRSKSRSRSRSRTRSSSRGSFRGRRSRSRSYSPRSNRSYNSRSRSPRSPRRRSVSRSRSSSPDRPMFTKRSPSPPTFGHFSVPQSGPIGGDNKGALLMQKMGWSGQGLGARETGIVEPIGSGEVRDKSGQYRGLGSALDPFEQFRKQRSSSYYDRNLMASMERERSRRD